MGSIQNSCDVILRKCDRMTGFVTKDFQSSPTLHLQVFSDLFWVTYSGAVHHFFSRNLWLPSFPSIFWILFSPSDFSLTNCYEPGPRLLFFTTIMCSLYSGVWLVILYHTKALSSYSSVLQRIIIIIIIFFRITIIISIIIIIIIIIYHHIVQDYDHHIWDRCRVVHSERDGETDLSDIHHQPHHHHHQHHHHHLCHRHHYHYHHYSIIAVLSWY